LRRRVFAVVLVLTLLFLGLFGLANHYVFRDVNAIRVPEDVNVDARTFAGAFLFGLAMFGTLFLGVVLSVFLTLGVVSGDAERGLLQPLVVRPIGRSALLLARFLGAAAVCIPYTLGVFFAAMVITGLIGDWWPGAIAVPALELTFAVLVLTALSLLGSIFLSATANGIAIFMVFGAGLVAGLLGTVGHALGSETLSHAAVVAAWVLPFEGLYQDSLRQITAHEGGLTGFLLQLGPFGGGYTGGWGLRLWAVAFLVITAAVARQAFALRDL
jgi:ABC-type transport system involved in multi-copper enzyme maturation permease subunit